MESVLILALVALALAAALPALFALRRRLANARELELWRMLERRGLSAADAAAESPAFARAVRRCALCANAEQCREWLARGGHGAPEDFCPNAAYLERLDRP